MLSLKKGVDFFDLSENEIDIIAEHENVPEIIAAEIGSTLLKTPAGICLIKLYMIENIESARSCQQFDKARQLETIYRHFDDEHPGASPY